MPSPVVKLLLFVLLAAPLSAQTPAPEVELKDPETARQYAWYFSGAGHLYTGEALRGGVMLGVTTVSLYKAIGELFSGCTGNLTSTAECHRGRGFLWLGLAAAPYVYSIIDAPKSAERVNAGKQRKAGKLSIAPLLDVDHSNRLQAGIQLWH